MSLYRKRLNNHFGVQTAVDGLSAVRKVREYTPRVIVSDYDLPLLSGKALLKFVRSHSPTASSPFIFLTKSEFDPDALNLGANDWLIQHHTNPSLLIERIYVQISRA